MDRPLWVSALVIIFSVAVGQLLAHRGKTPGGWLGKTDEELLAGWRRRQERRESRRAGAKQP